MKFKEKNYITITKYPKVFVYFLIKDGEVVYVGQTRNGIVRPFSHYDKDFDTVKIIPYESEDMLDYNEDFYIRKYYPKYNKTLNSNMSWGLQKTKTMLSGDLDIEDLDLRKLKKTMKLLDIQPKEYYNVIWLSCFDIEKLYEYYTKQQEEKHNG